MASLHLTTTSRTSSSLLKSLFSSPSSTGLFSSLALPLPPSSSSSPSALGSSTPGLAPLGSLLQDLWETILRAVPKTRTSHSKKRRRATNKQLKDKLDITSCRACGRPKLSSSICPHCKSAIQRDAKNEKRVLGLIEEAKARGEDPFEIFAQRQRDKEEEHERLTDEESQRGEEGSPTGGSGVGRS
ncbi:hypothetical protein BDY24DRAFT_379725 [Mrakia frigida]|uniref:mitochondrial 54S ribosomal protein bL32m MRPL32 n=1 Tax=Mrakia frigida TaxID=29902 RepID=UPI003FCBF953